MKITKQSKELYQKANETLSLINQAWQKSEAESPRFLICQNVKSCMNDFLNCYLLMKNGKVSDAANLNDLVTQCAAMNERFKEIDLRWINCKDHDPETSADVFCTSTERNQACTWIANGIKKVIDAEIKNAGVAVA